MHVLQKLGLTLATGAAINLSVYAAEPESIDPFELDLEQNISTPIVPPKKHINVKEQTDKVKSALERQGFKASRLREGEALVVTIACSQLFHANESELSHAGRNLLQKFRLPSELDDKYKVLITVHTDDTGDETYAELITESRANAIDDFLGAMTADTGMIIVPYGIGRDEPLVTNDSMLNRAKNRRAEIYIVPTLKLFEHKK